MSKIICALMGIILSISVQGQDSCAKYRKIPGGYIMVLRIGEDILPNVEMLANTEKIPSANFRAIGFVNMVFGFFDFQTKEYQPRSFNKVELASMTGSIAWKQGKPSIHAHGVVTDENFTAYGGHILSGTVSTGSVEIYITLHTDQMERKRDERIGADVLCVPQQ